MARPRKDQGDCAEQRIKDTFWILLHDNDLKNITVSMITKNARCNRGTFYYHFNSLENLINNVINEELFDENSIPRAFFCLICKSSNPFTQSNFIMHARRFGLLLNRAGEEKIDAKVKVAVANIWEKLLCQNGEKMTTEARLIIEYTISGLIGLISYLYREGLLDCSNMPKESYCSLEENSQYLVASLSRAQNIPLQELETRICDQLKSTQSHVCKECMRNMH